ncbi:MAG: hypothetical protein ACYDEY_09420 [Acidimicrobiales bacterium]
MSPAVREPNVPARYAANPDGCKEFGIFFGIVGMYTFGDPIEQAALPSPNERSSGLGCRVVVSVSDGAEHEVRKGIAAGDSGDCVNQSFWQQHEKQIKLLEAEFEKASADTVSLVAKREEPSAKAEVLTANVLVVELPKQVFGGRAERAKNATDAEQGPCDEPASGQSDASGAGEMQRGRRKRGQQPGSNADVPNSEIDPSLHR